MSAAPAAEVLNAIASVFTGGDWTRLSVRYRLAEEVVTSLREAGYLIVPNGEHLLHQTEDSWAMEHTVECRQRGLMQCVLHELACSGAWEGVEPGTYVLTDVPGEPVRLEVQS